MTAPRIYIVTGEHSGDRLGAKLMAELQLRFGDGVAFAGLGGPDMEAQGLTSLFPLDEVTVMGPIAILKQYPRLRRRALEVVDDGAAFDPDLLIIIDAPELTHPIAKRMRKKRPGVPVLDYVSPSVWAWRPGRARKMAKYVDHLLALLPFEPEAHARLGGPPCTYVGHPLVERLDWIDALDTAPLAARLGLAPGTPVLCVLPGSRGSEVDRLMRPFGETVDALAARAQAAGKPAPAVVIPAVPRQRDAIATAAKAWKTPVTVLDGEDEKWRAFKLADAALAASGTVTLELAVAGTPMVVGYKVDPLAATLRFLVQVRSIVLANLVLDENAFPEFIQEACEADNLAPALALLLDHASPDRQAQVAALARLRTIMQSGIDRPSARAADVVAMMLDKAC